MKEADKEVNTKLEQCGDCSWNWNFIGGDVGMVGWCYMFKDYSPDCKQKRKINDYRNNEAQAFTTPNFGENHIAESGKMEELKKDLENIIGYSIGKGVVLSVHQVKKADAGVTFSLDLLWQWFEKKLKGKEGKIKFWVDAWNLKERQYQEAKTENEKLKNEIYAKPEIDDLIKRDPVSFFLVNAIRTLTNEQRITLIALLLERTENTNIKVVE